VEKAFRKYLECGNFAHGFARTHRHRYYGVLAPNSPLRAAVTAMAQETGEGVEAEPDWDMESQSPHRLASLKRASLHSENITGPADTQLQRAPG